MEEGRLHVDAWAISFSFPLIAELVMYTFRMLSNIVVLTFPVCLGESGVRMVVGSAVIPAALDFDVKARRSWEDGGHQWCQSEPYFILYQVSLPF